MNDREAMRKVAGVAGPSSGKIITHPPSDAYSEGWDAVFGHACERCGKKPATSITRFDHEAGETVHAFWGCGEFPYCGRELSVFGKRCDKCDGKGYVESRLFEGEYDPCECVSAPSSAPSTE